MGQNDYRIFGDFLLERQIALGKTRIDFERKFGSVITNWYGGISLPEIKRLRRIAKVYKTTFDELMHVYTLAKQAREAEKRGRTFHRKSSTAKKENGVDPEIYGNCRQKVERSVTSSTPSNWKLFQRYVG